MTTIKLKNGSGAPTAGDLVQGEPALDLTNKRLYTEDSGGTVIEVGTNPTSVTTGAITATGIDVTGTVTADNFTVDSGRILTAQGAQTTGYGFAGDGDSAMYQQASNQLQFSTANTERMRIDASGNVGIGTSSPSSKLHLSGDGDSASKLTVQRTGATTGTATLGYNYVGSFSNNEFKFYSNSTERMVINSSGNVGIGTSSPQEELHIEANYPQLRIASNLNVLGSNNLTATVDGYATNGLAWRIGRVFGSADMEISNERSSAMTFATGSTERMRIDSSGNLLVGKTSASVGTDGAQLLTGGYSGVSATSTTAFFANRNTTDGDVVEIGKNGVKVGSIGVDSGDNFYISASAASHAGLYFSDVGIAPMEAGSLIDASVDLGSSSYRFENLYLSGKVHLQYPGNSYYAKVEVDSSTNLILGAGPNGAEAARIDSSGNLLVGTTDKTLVGRVDSARVCIDNLDGDDCLQLKGSGVNHLNIASWIPLSDGGYHIGFGDGTSSYTERGVISTNGSVTNYGGTSDYRLKENVIELTGAINRVKRLSPSRFNFINEPEQTIDGFIAHEVQEIVPEAVVGEKDALKEDGSIRPQQLDNSKLVPLLTAALQEALEKIDNLEARLLQLETN